MSLVHDTLPWPTTDLRVAEAPDIALVMRCVALHEKREGEKKRTEVVRSIRDESRARLATRRAEPVMADSAVAKLMRGELTKEMMVEAQKAERMREYQNWGGSYSGHSSASVYHHPRHGCTVSF